MEISDHGVGYLDPDRFKIDLIVWKLMRHDDRFDNHQCLK